MPSASRRREQVPALFDEVRTLAADSEGGMFQVPPYFAYIAKSFSVLEGIGLTADPEYSVSAAQMAARGRLMALDGAWWPRWRLEGAWWRLGDGVRARVDGT